MSSSSAPTAVDPAHLAALEAAGWNRHDPLRWRFIVVLAQRAQASPPGLQARLQARCRALLADYQAGMAAASAAAGSFDEPALAPAAPPRRGPLAGLLEHIAARAEPAPELKTLQRFRRTWTRLAADQRVVRSRTRLPTHAGPLNSQRLVHRALTVMREVSPDYLAHFVAHADALLWLERAGGGDLLMKKDVLQKDAPTRRRKPRTPG